MKWVAKHRANRAQLDYNVIWKNRHCTTTLGENTYPSVNVFFIYCKIEFFSICITFSIYEHISLLPLQNITSPNKDKLLVSKILSVHRSQIISDFAERTPAEFTIQIPNFNYGIMLIDWSIFCVVIWKGTLLLINDILNIYSYRMLSGIS